MDRNGPNAVVRSLPKFSKNQPNNQFRRERKSVESVAAVRLEKLQLKERI
jgi:hypothetical protein